MCIRDRYISYNLRYCFCSSLVNHDGLGNGRQCPLNIWNSQSMQWCTYCTIMIIILLTLYCSEVSQKLPFFTWVLRVAHKWPYDCPYNFTADLQFTPPMKHHIWPFHSYDAWWDGLNSQSSIYHRYIGHCFTFSCCKCALFSFDGWFIDRWLLVLVLG